MVGLPLASEFQRITFTPSTPGSPVSCKPFLLVSANTLSPIEPKIGFNPASTVRTFGVVAVKVTGADLPPTPASESKAGSPPWVGVTKLCPAGATNCTEYVPSGRLLNKYLPSVPVVVLSILVPAALSK